MRLRVALVTCGMLAIGLVLLAARGRRSAQRGPAAGPGTAPATAYDARRGLGGRYLDGGDFPSSLDVSPDGRTIVFSSLRHESSELYCVPLAGGPATRLTNTPFWEVSPVFSSDGRRIFFLSDAREPEGELFAIDAAGEGRKANEPKPLAVGCRQAYDPARSPDGKLLAFTAAVDGHHSVFVVGQNGSGLRRVSGAEKEAYSPRFTPAGDRVVFAREWAGPAGGLADVAVAGTDGTGEKVLVPASGSRKRVISATAVGGRIVFTAQSLPPAGGGVSVDLWVADADGGSPRRLPTGNRPVASAVVSPDGSRIAYVSDEEKAFEYDLYVIPVDGRSPPRRLTTPSAYFGAPVFTPDGQSLVTLVQKANAPGRGRGEICVVSLKDGTIRVVTRND